MSSSEESDLKSDYDEQVQQAPKEINKDMNHNDDDDLDQDDQSSYSSEGRKPQQLQQFMVPQHQNVDDDELPSDSEYKKQVETRKQGQSMWQTGRPHYE